MYIESLILCTFIIHHSSWPAWPKNSMMLVRVSILSYDVSCRADTFATQSYNIFIHEGVLMVGACVQEGDDVLHSVSFTLHVNTEFMCSISTTIICTDTSITINSLTTTASVV